MSLSTPPKVRKLQEALHAKAKGTPTYRFYALYDKLYREDVLSYAYGCCQANGGSPGVDGQSFANIESRGLERWLSELAEELRNKTYRPEAVRRVWISKPGGQQRPLGIPTIKDRVVQTAAVIILGPIFEADLPSEQYAYRPERSALDAVQRVHTLMNRGHTEVVDADLSGYFDSIPHSDLMKSLARRISDRHMLHLIKMWLQMPTEEEDEHGRKQRKTRNKDEHRGTPQGAPLSPLLANLYMRRFILGWRVLGFEEALQAKIVNYADDFVICCRHTAEEAMKAMRQIMAQLKLTINESKTRIRKVPDESFEFLGYTIGRCYSVKTGKAYIGTRPSKQKISRVCREISEITACRWTLLDVQNRVQRLNRIMIGWANYFRLGPVSKAYRAIDTHARYRLRQWLRRKHKVQDAGTARFPDEYLHEKLGLVRLELRTRTFPWANA